MDCCRNPILRQVWRWDSHSQKWELGVLWDSQNFKARLQGQNSSPRGVIYTIGKVLKCRCWKWPHMSHSDICSTSYGRKKGRESNCQFDSRPLKVGNRPNPSVCAGGVRHTVGKFLRRATSLLQTSSQSEVWTRSPIRDSFGTPPRESRN